MSSLETWTEGSHTAEVDGRATTHPTYRKGSGPPVILIHELPGLTTGVIGFGEELVRAGYIVVMPHLFGRAGVPFSGGEMLRTMPKVCISREFTMLKAGRTTPVIGWLRSLARELDGEFGGRGVGALGMCFTGGFALAMMVDDAVAAPVLAQPSLPMAIGARRSADLGLSPGDLARVKARCAAGVEVLGIHYRTDKATGTRFETLTQELGEAFLRVDLDGEGHSTLTEQRSQAAVDAVLAFFGSHLH